MSDLVTSRIFVDGEKGITAAKLNDITASSVIQPAFYTGKPTASTADPTDVMLILKAGAYTQVPVSTLAGSLSNAAIWSTRLRSYNAIANSNFEVDQRQCGASIALGSASSIGIDRWWSFKAGTMAGTAQQTTANPPVLVPGTNFAITSKFWRVTLTTQEAALGVNDYIQLYQLIEGPCWREMMSDVHSISLLVRSSVAGLTFGVFLQDPPTVTKTLTNLCTIPTVNTWTLITLPNLPVWPSGNFVTTPGSNGYRLGICLASGSNLTSPANGAWQNGNLLGATGQSNFAASPINSTFDIAFVQHEPGAVCSTLMDKPFTQNFSECQRYYQKSYPYGSAAGSTTGRYVGFTVLSGSTAIGNLGFAPTMAKTPTLTCYNASTGVVNQCYQLTTPNNAYQAAQGTVSDSGMGSIINGAANFPTVGAQVGFFYTADTGW
jgi:hypothetical protein